MWWWIRFTLSDSLSKLWVSCTLDVYVFLESQGRLLPLLMSWISHEIILSVRFSVGRRQLFLLYMPFHIYHRLQLSSQRPISHPLRWFRLDAQTLVCTNAGFPTTTMTQLRCLVWGVCTWQSRVPPPPRGDDEGITSFERVYTRRRRVFFPLVLVYC